MDPDQLPLTIPNQSGIPVHWREGEVIPIVIRQSLRQTRRDFSPDSTPPPSPEYQMLMMLHLEAGNFSASMRGKRVP